MWLYWDQREVVYDSEKPLNGGFFLYIPATQQECKPFEHKDYEGKIDNGKMMDFGIRKTSFSISSLQ